MDTASKLLAKVDAKQQVFHTYHITQLLGVAPKTVLRWIHSGRLRAVRSPGKWYVLRADFIAFINRMPTEGDKRDRK